MFIVRYSTVCHWDFDNPVPLNDKGKPFSRLVWRSTQQLGIGKATFPVDNFNCTAVVARYSPYVNTQNYAENVQKGKFVPTGCQYVNNVENEDFILPPQPGKACQRISGFKGQMLQESSTCTIKQYLQFSELQLEEESKDLVLFYKRGVATDCTEQ